MMKCNHPIYTTQHGNKKYLHSALSQRKKSRGRKVITHCRTGNIHPQSELAEFFLSLQMNFIKPSISFFQTCLHFSLAGMMEEKLIFYSFQNKHYSSVHCTKSNEFQCVLCGWLEYHLYAYIQRWLVKCTETVNLKTPLNYGGNLVLRKQVS